MKWQTLIVQETTLGIQNRIGIAQPLKRCGVRFDLPLSKETKPSWAQVRISTITPFKAKKRNAVFPEVNADSM